MPPSKYSTSFSSFRKISLIETISFAELDCSDKEFSFNFKEVTADQLALWIIPFLAFAAQMLTSVVQMQMQKKMNPDQPNMMGMMLTMPLISLWIGFTLPGGVTFYWACSSLIGGLIQIAVQQLYGPHKLLSKEREKELVKQCDFEAGQIAKFSAKDED